MTFAANPCPEEQDALRSRPTSDGYFIQPIHDAGFARHNSGENPIGSFALPSLNGWSLWNFPPRGPRKMREVEGTHMEMDSITSRTELICADCGVRFRARRVVDGVEEICDGCYEKRFPAREPSSAILHRRRHSLAAD